MLDINDWNEENDDDLDNFEEEDELPGLDFDNNIYDNEEEEDDDYD